MFSGIIRNLGKVVSVDVSQPLITIGSDLFSGYEQYALGDSIAVSGVCLTISKIENGQASFDLLSETLRQTTLGTIKSGDFVNLETSLKVGQTVDGHFVQGHVDGCGEIIEIWEEAGSRCLKISMPEGISDLICDKGSVAVDGVSLTTNKVNNQDFIIYLIPTTLEFTTLGNKKVGDSVNLEADALARYAKRILENRK